MFYSNDTATTEIFTLSLHDALPICVGMGRRVPGAVLGPGCGMVHSASCGGRGRVSGARPVYGAERLWPTTPCDEGVKVPRRSSMDRCDPARDRARRLP